MLIGCIGLRLDMTPRVGNLGYWIGRRFWGHGVGTEATSRLSRWALANLDLDRLEAHVAVDNPASAAVLRRAGFREVGTGMEPFLARGGKHPVIRFEATRDDLFGKPDPEPSAEPGRKLVLVAACALIDVDGRILLTRRPEGKAMAGLWEFPGGKLLPGEAPEQGVIRELREELGIDIASHCLAPFAFASHAYELFHLMMPLFLCRRWSGRPEGLEGQALAWVRPDKLDDYAMPPADKPLIPLLRDFLYRKHGQAASPRRRCRRDARVTRRLCRVERAVPVSERRGPRLRALPRRSRPLRPRVGGDRSLRGGARPCGRRRASGCGATRPRRRAAAGGGRGRAGSRGRATHAADARDRRRDRPPVRVVATT